jgi:hypothetical protein
MHPSDERDFEQLLLADESVRFIGGPRWNTQEPVTSRSLADIHNTYCIIWSTSEISQLNAEYIPTCNDWYCRSEHATIQFLRSEMDDTLLIEGRIAISTVPSIDFPELSVKNLEMRYGTLRKYLRKRYSNSIVQWRDPTRPYAPRGPNRSANPSKPDAQLWVGPHALRWLREGQGRRCKQMRQSNVEAVLVDGIG